MRAPRRWRGSLNLIDSMHIGTAAERRGAWKKATSLVEKAKLTIESAKIRSDDQRFIASCLMSCVRDVEAELEGVEL